MAKISSLKVTLVPLTADDIWTAEHPYSACVCGWEECEPKRVYYPSDAAYREACESASRAFYSHEYGGCAADDEQDIHLVEMLCDDEYGPFINEHYDNSDLDRMEEF